MATIQLGKIKQVWRGTYNNSTAYTVDDLVEYTDSGITSTYICVADSTGNAPSSSGTAHASWNYVAKGVADPIPTQSGNAGKALITDGSSVSWGDGGAWTKIASGSGPSTAVSTLTLDNIFSDTYKFYKIYISWRQDDWIKFRFVKTSDGAVQTTSAYTWVLCATHENTDGGPSRYGNSAVTYFPGNYWNCTDSGGAVTELDLVNPYSSSFKTMGNLKNSNNENAQLHSTYGGFYYDGNESHKGLYISGDSGDLISDTNFDYLVLGAKA